MSKLYFEDFHPGQTFTHGPRTVTRDEIVSFAAQYDPQPMHLDEIAGRDSLLGGLGASGWHSCGIMMRMICDAFLLNSASMGAGAVDEVKWLRPVRADDRLMLHATVKDVRASRTRPQMGIVTIFYELSNQADERVMTMATPSLMERRHPGAPS